MSRADLLRACHEQCPHSADWYAAVQRLGAASKAGFPEAKKPGRPTGKSRGELYHQMLRSSAFDTDRDAWLRKWYASPTAATWDEMSQELKNRKLATKQAAA
jgi:hypothetical protein